MLYRAYKAEKIEYTDVNHAPRLMVWLLYGYVILSPFSAFSFLNIAGRGFGRADWLIVVLMVGACIAYRLRPYRSPANKFVLLFIFSAILSAYNLLNISSNAQVTDYFTTGAQLLLAVAFFFVVSSLSLNERELRTGLRIWIITALLVSLYAIYQVVAFAFNWPFAHLEFTNPSITYAGGEARIFARYLQVSSVFREPSYLGSYLIGPIILLSLFLLKGRGNLLLSKSFMTNLIILVVLSLALFLTSSQSAYLTLLAVLGFMYLSGLIARTKTIKLLLGFAFFLIIGGLLAATFQIDFLGSLVLRFKYLILNMMNPEGTLEVTSYRVRSECTLAALKIWASHPLLGVGLNNMRYHTDVCEFSMGWAQLLADQGLFGLVALGLLLWSLFRSLKKLSGDRRLPAFWSIVCIVIIFILISDIVNGVFTSNWDSLQRWFTLAIANLLYIRANSILSADTG